MEGQLRVLCYGDSLTAGLVRRRIWNSKKYKASYHPYAHRLGRRLKEHVIDHVGLCGWTTAELLEDANLADTIHDGYSSLKHEAGPGLATMLQRAREQERTYDAVVLLSGTNDLGQEDAKDCAGIAGDISELHALCRAEGVAQTLALTIPHSDFERRYEAKHGRPDPTRAAVNKALRLMCSAEPTMCLVDLEAAVNRNRLELDFPNYDGLHFPSTSYDALGDIVADHLCRVFPGACAASFLVDCAEELQRRIEGLTPHNFIVKDNQNDTVDAFSNPSTLFLYPLQFFELKLESICDLTQTYVRKESRSRPGFFYYMDTVTGESQAEPPAPWKKVESRRKLGVFYYYNPDSGERVLEKPEL